MSECFHAVAVLCEWNVFGKDSDGVDGIPDADELDGNIHRERLFLINYGLVSGEFRELMRKDVRRERFGTILPKCVNSITIKWDHRWKRRSHLPSSSSLMYIL